MNIDNIIKKTIPVYNIKLPAIFMSDIHIENEDDGKLKLIKNTIDNKKIKTIIFLGDIFHAWTGKDSNPELSKIWEEMINDYKNKDMQIFFITGNHDFIIKHDQILCGTILDDPSILIFNDKRVMVTHGDMFCIDDKLHMLWRKVYNSFLSKIFLKLPQKWRKNIRKKCLQASNIYKKNTDLNSKITEQLIAKYNLDNIIHGHTHNGGIRNKIITLGHWQNHASYYLVNEDDTHFIN